MPSSLPRSAPADQQVDPAAILSFLDAVEERPDIEMHSLMVVRHGRVVAEGWWAPYSAERPQLLYSLSKSFTSTAAAFAQAEGLLDLDDTVVSHFPEFAADITDPRSRSVKVRHVASMAAGHTREMLAEAIMRDREEPVRGFLLIPPDRDPGTVFAYSQPCTYALASIIQRNAGMPLPATCGPGCSTRSASGTSAGIPSRPGESKASAACTPVPRTSPSSGCCTCREAAGRAPSSSPGNGWPRRRRSRSATRANPTRLAAGLRLPVLDVPARVPRRRGLRAVLRGLARAGRGDRHHRLHARHAGRPRRHVGPPAARPRHGLPRRRSRARPAQLQARPPRAGRQRSTCRFWRAGPADWGPWTSGPFTIAASTAGTQVQPFLTSVEVAPRADGWQISLIEPANALTFPVGTGAWTVSDHADRNGETIPVAASGGWLDDRTLRAEVIFLETPHRMDITCSLTGRTAEAVWRHPPLTPSKLQHLHCPS